MKLRAFGAFFCAILEDRMQIFPLKQIVALVLSVFEIITPVAVSLTTSSGQSLSYEWSEELEFTEEHYTEIEKTPEEDFRILNLSDIQLYDNEIYDESLIEHQTLGLVAKAIEDAEPDLITISGDSFCSTLATLEIIDLIDSYGIPWAPVLGNHDGAK